MNKIIPFDVSGKIYVFINILGRAFEHWSHQGRRAIART